MDTVSNKEWMTFLQKSGASYQPWDQVLWWIHVMDGMESRFFSWQLHQLE